jgi:hypothetical protein
VLEQLTPYQLEACPVVHEVQRPLSDVLSKVFREVAIVLSESSEPSDDIAYRHYVLGHRLFDTSEPLAELQHRELTLDDLLGQCNDHRLQGGGFDEPDDNGKHSPAAIDLQQDVELRKRLWLERAPLDEPHGSVR